MARPCCHTCLAFILKFLNFLQAFLGISIIIYSVFMLNHWNKHSIPLSRNPLSNFNAVGYLAAGTLTSTDDVLNSLTAPWFIYAFMGVGVVLCCITCIGHIATEAINGCCLCFYSLLTILIILLEAAFVAFVALDHHWEKDLPQDPTGELDNLRGFIETNIEVSRVDPDDDRDYEVGGRTWEPLLHPQRSETSASYKGDARGSHSDIWSSRMREKYGLGGGEAAKHSSYNSNASVDMKSSQ